MIYPGMHCSNLLRFDSPVVDMAGQGGSRVSVEHIALHSKLCALDCVSVYTKEVAYLLQGVA